MNIFTVLLTQPLTNGLIIFYQVLGQNMGLAILFFSLFLIFVMRPLTKPYLESMKKIKEIQPAIDKLKKKYGKDKMKFSQAQAELYKEKKINPAAGCLPYILQFAILIALFNVFTTAFPKSGDPLNTVNALNQRLYSPLKLPENEPLNTKFLYLDISQPDKLSRLVPGVPDFIPGIFVILAALGQLLSVKITAPYVSAEEKIAKKTKSQADDLQVTMQQSMTYTLPLMTLWFGLQFQSGLAIYWLVFSLVSVWQQVTMNGWGSLTPFVRKLGLLKSGV